MAGLKLPCRVEATLPRSRHILEDGRVRLQLPDELGECFHDYVELEPGLGISQLHYSPSVPLIEESNGLHPGRVMVITLGMQGCSSYRGDDRTQLEFAKGHTTISSFHGISGERCYNAGETISQLRVIVHESLISKYVGESRAEAILGHDPLSRLAFRASTPAALAHARAVMNHLRPDQSHLPRLDIHIHTLNLLSEQFNLLAPVRDLRSSPFTPSEIDRLEKTRNWMKEHLDNPLTLDYLSTRMGISKTKLKDGMLYLYQRTPSDLLLDLRMKKATLLLESGLQVSQVAWQVGYKYANNFTAAFTRYYGKSPRAMFGRKRCSDRTP